MRKIIFFLFVTTIFSCRDEHPELYPVCSQGNPTEDLAWLKADIEEWEQNEEFGKYYFVQQARYKGRDIFVVGFCCPFCLSIPLIYNCEGEQLENVPLDDIKSTHVVWKHPDAVCEL